MILLDKKYSINWIQKQMPFDKYKNENRHAIMINDYCYINGNWQITASAFLVTYSKVSVDETTHIKIKRIDGVSLKWSDKHKNFIMIVKCEVEDVTIKKEKEVKGDYQMAKEIDIEYKESDDDFFNSTLGDENYG